MSNNFVWDLGDLPELKTADNLAFKAEGIQVPQVKLIGAVTYHWELVGEQRINDSISVADWSAVGSISKGISTHLLSQYRHRHMRVYRPKLLLGVQDGLKPYLLKRYDHYGDQHYDKKGVVMVGAWCLAHKAGWNVEWWEHNNSAFWCLEFNNLIWRDMGELKDESGLLISPIPGFMLVPDTEPAYPTNMENSPNLELVWGTF